MTDSTDFGGVLERATPADGVEREEFDGNVEWCARWESDGLSRCVIVTRVTDAESFEWCDDYVAVEASVCDDSASVDEIGKWHGDVADLFEWNGETVESVVALGVETAEGVSESDVASSGE